MIPVATIIEERAAGSAADPGPLVIVNGDDFGMTAGISRGILRCWELGLVTSCSALVVGAAFDRFAERLRDCGLPTGCHLSAVGEDRPLLSKREIPTLTDADGCFPRTWRHFAARAGAGRIDSDDLRREFTAQLELLESAGIRPRHLDTHQNLHLWPQVASVVIGLACAQRIEAIRIPRSAGRGFVPIAVRRLSTRLERTALAAGLRFPASSIGIDELAGLEASDFERVITTARSEGTPSVELIAHLALGPDPDRVRFDTRFDWEAQLAALQASGLHASIGRAGARLGAFADLGAVTEHGVEIGSRRVRREERRIGDISPGGATTP